MTTDHVKKSAVRYFVVAIFCFNLIVLAGGLQFVKNYAASEATKSTLLASNKTACTLRALVEPQINNDLLVLHNYESTAAKRPKVANHDLLVKRAHDTRLKIASERGFLEAYATTPPDLDCSTILTPA